MLFHGGLLPLHRRQFRLGEFAQFRVIAFEHRAMVGDLVEDFAIFANRAYDLAKLGPFAREQRVFAIVRDHRGVADTTFKVGEAVLNSLELIEHRQSVREKAIWRKETALGLRRRRTNVYAQRFGHVVAGVAGVLTPYLRLKRSTRPAVSTRRCVPV